jgi:tetratricopeptide (TPR) repeat protein
MADVKLFLSCVSDEFGAWREALRHELTSLNLDVAIQEDFGSLGVDTLSKLHAYIRNCDAVIHLTGAKSGAAPNDFVAKRFAAQLEELEKRLPPLFAAMNAGTAIAYTQWEAWLALYYGKALLIARPDLKPVAGTVADGPDAVEESQAAHLRRLREVGIYPEIRFANADQLAARTIKALFSIFRRPLPPARRPRNLPFASLGGLFAGREEDLAELHTALLGAKGAPVALCGLGGIGKTRLAIEYGWSREAVYSALLFVSASDGAALNAGLAALTAFENLDLPEKEARDDATKITAVLRWLESNPTWVMILDNVDDRAAVAQVAKLMPRLKGGHVVITARASNFPAGVRKLQVSTLDEDAAAQFLLDRTDGDRSKSRDDAALARTLARELGGLALGLEQVGAHIATDRIGFGRYLKLWNGSREKALAWADATVTRSDRTLATTWATSVARLSPASRGLLDRLAFLAIDPVPDSLLDVAVPGDSSDADAYKARGGLHAYSLISGVTAEGGAPGFFVHRLVQDFASRAMSEEQRAQALREALEWVNVAFIGDPQDVRDWLVLDPLAPHALAVARHADEAGIAEPTARLLNNLGVLFHVKADYFEAEKLKRRALAIMEKSYGPDHTEVATALNNLSELLKATNRLAEAEPLMRRALAIDETRSGPDHPNVARDLNNLAGLFQATNRLAEAEPRMRRALAIFETSLGPNHPSVATYLNNLGHLLQATNRVAEAEPLIRRALAIDEQSYGPNHPNTAIRLNNLAQLLQATNRLDEAEPFMRRGLAIDEQSYGQDHPNVAIHLNNLAELLRTTNRLSEAEPLYPRALAIWEKSLGPDHPNVASALNNLAVLLQATNRLAAAEPLMRRALAIVEKSFGRDHPLVAINLNNLAALLQDTNRRAEAEPLMRRALAIDEKSYGPDHPHVATRLNNLVGLLQNTNRLAEAEPMMRRALTIVEKSYGRDHPEVALHLNNLAELLRTTNRLSEAEPLYPRALAIFEKSLGPDHPQVAMALNNLALLLQVTNRVPKAEPLMRRALAILEKSLGPSHPWTVSTRDSLAAMEAALGKGGA